MRADYLNNNSGKADLKLKVETINAAKTLTALDSGKVFMIQQDSAYEITLPLAATAGAGWHAKFILSEVASNAVTIANNTSEDTIVGMTVGADGGAGSSAESAVDEIVFISGAQLGDQVELLCDGAVYYAKATAHDVAHITIS
jgi:hypothetical protein|tara:strand:+ start:1208 stop:1636 length:429 start_codon:yes stop_codon:yes gene_type:complete